MTLAKNTILDLSAEYARLKAELNSRANSLEFIAKELRNKTSTIDSFIEKFAHFMPNAQNVSQNAYEAHKNELVWQEYKIKET